MRVPKFGFCFAFNTLILLLVLLPISTDSTLSKSDRKEKKNVAPESEKWDTPEAMEELPSLKAEINPGADSGELMEYKAEILANHNKLDVGERQFTTGNTLGYVTVWNNHGYDVAKWAAKKFTHIAPVWFQLKSARIDGQLSCKVEGTHDIDIGWIEDVRKNNSAVKIVPRFLFENWQGNDLKQFLTEEQAQFRCVRAIVDLLLRTELDGAVVEIWLQIMAMTRGSSVQYLLELIESWSEQFHRAGLLFILPLSPPLNAGLQEIGIVNPDVIKRLVSSVDFLNVMTYDFPNSEISGVAPLPWVEANIRYFIEATASEQEDGPAKIMMGLNFYGYDRSGGGSEAILGKKYIEFLSRPDAMLTFDSEAGEHRLIYGDNGIIYFPTTRSIQMREIGRASCRERVSR